MCMVDFSDPADVCRTKLVTARKHHRCCDCGMVIHPGENYEYAFTATAGESSTYKTCHECLDAGKWLVRECNGYCFGLIGEDLNQHWYDDRIHTLELGRLIVMHKRRYKIARLFTKGYPA